jgi:hypothetical protein
VIPKIFQEELNLYEQYRQRFPEDEEVKKEKEKCSEVMVKMAQDVQNAHLGTVLFQTPALFKGSSKMSLNPAERPIEVGDIVMFPSLLSKNTTFFGRILKIHGKVITIRCSDGKEKNIARGTIIQQF